MWLVVCVCKCGENGFLLNERRTGGKDDGGKDLPATSSSVESDYFVLCDM